MGQSNESMVRLYDGELNLLTEVKWGESSYANDMFSHGREVARTWETTIHNMMVEHGLITAVVEKVTSKCEWEYVFPGVENTTTRMYEATVSGDTLALTFMDCAHGHRTFTGMDSTPVRKVDVACMCS